ncbi:uncharacterized protein OCT59_008191 [Rhizophagus irregularis]|uniref:Myb-like domain-containing protein n=2 Tax=Rhizophagus irregularis TaxID=588596 RepID=A0A015K7V5_RHIIW|nr:hypothetical protein GLOIN_2v1627838 [Rhizophagus irregularis DAOM 181602=DAOM 197198]EXX75605.1 hypothetical protein RirG_040370 [Rhizophagus irregularis DAOM 197198w]UZO16821.1 hypothetical protein OCT59_008191 [Rhizophagus irregularis]POG69355.1 hypothetical protein GLOIN_2v1627838 [Rhizophagus irregularis DAOM 181602=DAOM 197198]CAG8561731.1 11651_t:CDS:2 [Rhizophagus irregularis]GBC42701.1 hypothetical protein RIR_jg21197.t1 [Rhizophagus irregularis DAOM 181602=DAOM 197198]|eukprot:XP_025176221.1 hypothetical protein GLOIN_2v1627838 [Rhizophagus irregularis DAOM 181602=DAOM 197198]
MSFAINFIIDHPDDENQIENSSNLNNYYWDDFFTSVNEISDEATGQVIQLQESEQKELIPKELVIEHSPIPKLPINLPSPSPLLEATKPPPSIILASPPLQPHLLSSTASNILPPIILPPLTPFAVNIPPPKRIELPTTIAIPPPEISTSPLRKSPKSPLKSITPKLIQRNSKVRPDEQELTRPSSPKSSIMNINKVATPEFPLNIPPEPKPVILMNSPKENPEKVGSLVDEMQVNLIETSENSQNSEENPTFEKLKNKQAWIKRMRLKFSVRPEFEITQNILHPDGSLNQDYFRPSKGSIPQIQRKWSDKERVLLIKGIEKYGIGHYKEISDEFLPDWSAQDLRVKTMRLIGRQNLQLYKEWKGDENAIKIEYEKNKNIGLKTGMWKAGTLVYDDNGVVLKMIQEMSGDSKKRKRNGQDNLEGEEEIEID